MSKNREYCEGSIKAFEKMLDTNSVERVTPEMGENNIVHYLPWRMVVKDQSVTTNFRMCMDASAKSNKSEVSLNQCLLQGPNMTLNLAKCLIKFTLGHFRAVADLEKAFLMILILLWHRDVLRFFWPEVPGDIRSRLLVYRFRVVLFGSISSPFLLAAVLEKVIKDDVKDTTLRKILQEGIYVDDLSAAVFKEETLLNLYRVCRPIFKARHFNWRKWSSNCPELNKLAQKDGVWDESSQVSVLGKLWCEGDVFTFKEMKAWDQCYHKLSALSFTNGPFDPTGEILPILTQMRVFMRSLWNKKLEWKQDFSKIPELVKRFDQLRADTKIVMQRKSPIETNISSDSEIHIFSDASEASLGAVMYIVTPPNEFTKSGHIKQIFARTKLTPPVELRFRNEDTIPRWELLGMLLGAQVVNFVSKDIDCL